MKEQRIETEELVVVDASGRTRFALSAKDDLPRFHMYAEDGSVLASLSVGNNMPTLHLMDKLGKCLLSVLIAPDGAAAFTAYSKDSGAGSSIGITDGVPNIVLHDRDKNTIVISVAGISNPDLERR